VFTAGIGEHAAEIRARICARCAWLDIILDEHANSAARQQISAQASRVRVYVIATDEERMLAEHTVKHIG
jgi:acetate kinase